MFCVCAEVLVVCDFHTPVFGYARRKQCVVVRLYVFQLNMCSLLYIMTCNHIFSPLYMMTCKMITNGMQIRNSELIPGWVVLNWFNTE